MCPECCALSLQQQELSELFSEHLPNPQGGHGKTECHQGHAVSECRWQVGFNGAEVRIKSGGVKLSRVPSHICSNSHCSICFNSFCPPHCPTISDHVISNPKMLFPVVGVGTQLELPLLQHTPTVSGVLQ